MIFERIITLEWYDNVISAFATTGYGDVFYLSLLGGDKEYYWHKKVYLCINIRDLKGYETLLKIIAADSYKENCDKLGKLIVVKEVYKECYLVKATNLFTSAEFVRYKDNFRWPPRVLWGGLPENIEDAAKIDDWSKYY